jgi:hypothetical protein
MKKVYLFIVFSVIVIAGNTQTTRYWVGGSSGNFTDGAKWSSSSGGSPIGGTISWSNTDIARFDANSGSTTVYFTASETIGKLQISGNITVKMQNLYAYSYSLTIRTAATDALTVATASTLEVQGNYDRDMTVQLYSTTGVTANISGTVRVLTATGDSGKGQFEKSSSATINFLSGSSYIHDVNGEALPVANWNANSTCIVTGVTSSTPSNVSQQFGHFTWNCASQSGERSFTGNFGSTQGNFNLISTNNNVLKFSTTEVCVINVGGNFNIGSGCIFEVSGGSANNTLNIGGDFTQTGGDFTMCRSSSAVVAMTVNGSFSLGSGYFRLTTADGSSTLNLKGDFNMTSGFFMGHTSGSGGNVYFNGSTHNYSKTGGSINNNVNCIVTYGAIFILGNSVWGDYLYTTGTFTLQSGAILATAHPEGITSSGNSGCVRNNGTRSFHSNANYVYYRPGAQETGSGLPATLNGMLTVGYISSAVQLTLTNNTTMNGKIVMFSNSMTQSNIVSGTLQYGSIAMLEYKGDTHHNTSDIVFPAVNGPYTVIVDNNQGVTLHASRTIPGNLTIYQASFTIGNNNTLTLQGALQMSGGTLTGGTSSNLIVGGTGSNMSLPGITLNNFTLNRSGGVTLLNDMVIYGTLTLTNGIISGLSYMQKVYVVNTQSSAVAGGSANSYVNTPLARYLPQMLNTGNYFFPVGRSGNYYPFTLTEVKTGMAGIVQITVEAVAANCGGTPGTGLASLSTTEFWNATVFGGELLQARISAGRPSSLGNLNAIARCSSKTGTYSNLNGTVSGNNIINSDSTGVLEYFVLAEKLCIPPQLNAQYNGEESKEICTGQAYTLSANPSGGENCSGQWQYAWYTGTGNDNTYWNGSTWNNSETWGAWENISNVSPSVNTTYKVKVRCSTNHNCNAEDATGVAVTVHPVYAFLTDGILCVGDTFYWRGNAYTFPGIYIDPYQSQYGCDSNYVLKLLAYPKYKFTTHAEICDGEVYQWRGQEYSQEGTYIDHYLSQHGCDSNYVLSLTVHPAYHFDEDVMIYDNETPYEWHGGLYYTSGTYYANYFTEHNCDSIYELNLTVKPSVPLRVTKNIGRAVQAEWNAIPDATMYQLRYRTTSPQGTWIFVNQSTQLFRKIVPLDAYVEYELQIRHKVGALWHDWATVYAPVTFTTNDVAFESTYDIGNKFLISWTALDDVSSYVLQYRKVLVPPAGWTTKGYCTDNEAVMGSMEEGTLYEYRVCPRYDEVSFDWTHPGTITSNYIEITTNYDGGTSADFSWDPVEYPDASDYYLQISGLPSIPVPSGTTCSADGLTPGASYNYRLVVRYDFVSWGATSWRPLQVNPISKEEVLTLSAVNALTVYPNPVSDIMIVEVLTTAETVNVWSLYDASGKLVMSGTGTLIPGLNTFELDVSQLSAGLYMLQISFNGTVESARILKQ